MGREFLAELKEGRKSSPRVPVSPGMEFELLGRKRPKIDLIYIIFIISNTLVRMNTEMFYSAKMKGLFTYVCM